MVPSSSLVVLVLRFSLLILHILRLHNFAIILKKKFTFFAKILDKYIPFPRSKGLRIDTCCCSPDYGRLRTVMMPSSHHRATHRYGQSESSNHSRMSSSTSTSGDRNHTYRHRHQHQHHHHSASSSSRFFEFTEVPQWDALHSAAAEFRFDEKLHLRHLCNDTSRCSGLTAVHVSTWTTVGGHGTRGSGETMLSASSSQQLLSLPSYDDGSFLNIHDETTTGVEGGSGGGGGGGATTNPHHYHSTSSVLHNNFLRKIEEDEHEAYDQNKQLFQSRPFDRSKIVLDYSRQQVTGETMELLFDLADAVQFTERREAFRTGGRINITEDKPVLHHLLRMPKGYDFPRISLVPPSSSMSGTFPSTFLNAMTTSMSASSLSSMSSRGGRSTQSTQIPSSSAATRVTMATVAQMQQQQQQQQQQHTAPPVDDALKAIHDVRDKIESFSRQIRSNDPSISLRGVTNKRITDTLVVSSSGGMHIGTEFVHRALSANQRASKCAEGRTLHFISNVDPVDVFLETTHLDPERTLVVLVSKDFSNSIELFNFRAIRQWLYSNLCTTPSASAATVNNSNNSIVENGSSSSSSSRSGAAADTATNRNTPASATTSAANSIYRTNRRRRGDNPFGMDGSSIDSSSTTMLNDNNDIKGGGSSNAGGHTVTEAEISDRHIVAVTSCCPTSTNKSCLGIPERNVFRIWDWVIGRFSVCSAVGILPLSLQYSYGIVTEVLNGAHDMDEHFFNAPLRDNIPVLMGLLGVWNSTFMGYTTRAMIPYSEALRGLPSYASHIDMESNGKRVSVDGNELLHPAGEIDIGEVGGNTNHPFFQLMHQGRTIPADFIGFMESPRPLDLPGESVSNHDELMSYFFGQPDALAYGKELVDLVQEGIPIGLREHMVFSGNRPSSSILMTRLDPFSIGQLIALYEHRTAVQGFVWGINSFDQFGFELGRTFSSNVRSQLAASRKTGHPVQGFNQSTSTLLEIYLAHGKAAQKNA